MWFLFFPSPAPFLSLSFAYIFLSQNTLQETLTSKCFCFKGMNELSIIEQQSAAAISIYWAAKINMTQRWRGLHTSEPRPRGLGSLRLFYQQSRRHSGLNCFLVFVKRDHFSRKCRQFKKRKLVCFVGLFQWI